MQKKRESRITPEIVERIEDFLEERKPNRERREVPEAAQTTAPDLKKGERRSGEDRRQ